MNSSNKIKAGQIADFISNSTQTALNSKVNKSGDTMTGSLTATQFSLSSGETGYMMGNGVVDEKVFYNVLDYGVIGDGVSDDTSAFNYVITLANGNNGIVFIPPNVIVGVNDSILLPSNTTIQGGNKFTSVIQILTTGSTTAKVLRNEDFIDGNSNISLKNFAVDGLNLANTVCVEFQKCSGVTIDNMYITRGGIEGVYLYQTDGVIVSNLTAYYNGEYQVDASGIHFDTCTAFQLNGAVSHYNGFHGVICSSSSNGYIQATTHDNGYNGIMCQTGCTNIFIDCISYNNFRGVLIQDYSSYIKINGTIHSCTNGIVTNGCDYGAADVVTYNHIENDVYLYGEFDIFKLNYNVGSSTPIVVKEYETSLCEALLSYDPASGDPFTFIKGDGSLDYNFYQIAMTNPITRSTALANTNRIAKFTALNTIGQSNISDNGTTISFMTKITVSGTIYSSSAITGDSFKVTDGTSNQFLKGDGSLDSGTYRPIDTNTGTLTTTNATILTIPLNSRNAFELEITAKNGSDVTYNKINILTDGSTVGSSNVISTYNMGTLIATTTNNSISGGNLVIEASVGSGTATYRATVKGI